MASPARSGTRGRRPATSPGAPRESVAPAWAQGGETLTTAAGAPVDDTDNSLRVGERGPTLLDDFHLREKVMHFDHERIPERVVHARGAAAHGTFRLTTSIENLTCAPVLCDTSVDTPVFVRFSTVAGSRGSADTARDVRGFAVRFYTGEGNWDLVGNNMPVFFIQDGIKFPDLIHAAKPEPDREIPQAQTAHDTFWDFVSLAPESTHMLMWIMSDRAIPRSYRTMEGFGVHTFRLVNAEGGTTLVKFHWKPVAGKASLVWEEAQKLGGIDPDFHRRDLWDAIEAGSFPEWDFGIQVFPDTDDQTFEGIDLLDATKLVPEELAPVADHRPAHLEPQPDQLFRGDRAGGVLHRARASGDRLHRRSASPGPELLLPGHPADPSRRARTSISCRSTGRTRRSTPPSATGSPSRPSPRASRLQPELARRRLPVPRRGGRLRPRPPQVAGPRVRVRAQSFSDHYSQATLFWESMSPAEQDHIVACVLFRARQVPARGDQGPGAGQPGQRVRRPGRPSGGQPRQAGAERDAGH